MATKTSVVMDTVDQAQKKSSRSITYIDPNASNSDIKNFIEGLNGLTNQTLGDARRIDSTDILSDTKLPRNMQLSSSTIAASAISSIPIDPTAVTISGNNLVAADLKVSRPNENDGLLFMDWAQSNEDIYLLLLKTGDSSDVLSTSDIVFEMPEDSQYQSAKTKLTIKAE